MGLDRADGFGCEGEKETKKAPVIAGVFGETKNKIKM